MVAASLAVTAKLALVAIDAYQLYRALTQKEVAFGPTAASVSHNAARVAIINGFLDEVATGEVKDLTSPAFVHDSPIFELYAEVEALIAQLRSNVDAAPAVARAESILKRVAEFKIGELSGPLALCVAENFANLTRESTSGTFSIRYRLERATATTRRVNRKAWVDTAVVIAFEVFSGTTLLWADIVWSPVQARPNVLVD